MSQMAVGFPNAIRTDVSFRVFINNVKESSFSSFFKQCVLGLSGLLGLKCSNNFALLLQCNHCLVFGDV